MSCHEADRDGGCGCFSKTVICDGASDRRRHLGMVALSTQDILMHTPAYRSATAAVAAARSREVPTAVIVCGAVGVGKSTLIDALAHLSGREGFQVLMSDVRRSTQPGSFGTIIDLLASSRPSLHNEIDEFTIASRTVGSEAAIGADVSFALAIAGACDVLRTRGLPTFVIDDLGHADHESLSVLARELRRMEAPWLLIASVDDAHIRASEPVRFLVDWLEGHADLLRLDLTPLTRADLAELAEAVLALPPSPELVEAVQKASMGNPFLAEQGLLGWRESGTVVFADSRAELARSPVMPIERSDRIIKRIIGTDDCERRVAEVVAILGSLHLERLAMVAKVIGLPAARVGAAFDGLVARGVLTKCDGTYRLRAPLVADALLRALGTGSRWCLEQEMVAWLEERSQSPVILYELADLRESTAEWGDERAIDQLVRAADLIRAKDLSAAVRWYGTALTLMPRGHMDRPMVLARCARVMLLSGNVADALRLGCAASARLPPGEDRAKCERVVAEAFLARSVDSLADKGVAFFRDQIRERDNDARLLAASAHLLARGGRAAEAQATMEPIADLDFAGTVDQKVSALVHLARANGLLTRYDSMLTAIERTLSLVGQASFAAQVMSHGFLSYTLAEHGDPRATALIAYSVSLVQRSRWHLWDAELEISSILDDYRSGDWDSALHRIGNLSPGLNATNSMSRLATIRSIEVEILANRGVWAEARRRMSDHVHTQATEELETWAIAGIDVLSGDSDAAAAALERTISRTGVPRLRQILIARLAHAHLWASRYGAAIEATRDIVAGGHASTATLPALDAWRVFGAATRDIDVLREVFEAAVTRESPFLEAATRLELGIVQNCEAELRVAYQVFHHLRADPWRRRAAIELRKRGMKVPKQRKRRSNNLTDLELQVARLVQQGSRNRDVALSLSISVKTVEAYLTRIYRKTNCASRLELARYLDNDHSVE